MYESYTGEHISRYAEAWLWQDSMQLPAERQREVQMLAV
jgi:hypothetical protein